MRMNKAEILKLLPHRDPFLFVDEVIQIQSSEGITADPLKTYHLQDHTGFITTACYQVARDLTLLQGHFPGKPIFPGVLQVEMMAQVACLGIYPVVNKMAYKELDVALVSVTSAKFRNPIIPPLSLNIQTVCTRVRGHLFAFEGSIYSQDNTSQKVIYSQASFMATVRVIYQ